jgi:hypothetical protein
MNAGSGSGNLRLCRKIPLLFGKKSLNPNPEVEAQNTRQIGHLF